MPHHRTRNHTQRFPHRGQRHVDRPQHRLHHINPRQRNLITENVEHIPIDERRQRLSTLTHPLREHRTLIQQPRGHADPLRTLPREHEHHTVHRRRHIVHHTGRTLAPSDARHQRDRVLPHDHGPVIEHRTTGQTHRHITDSSTLAIVGDPARELTQRRLRLRRHHPRHHRTRPHLDRLHLGSLLHDHMRVRATDAERRHTRPPGPVGLRPLHRPRRQLHRAGGPVDVRRRLTDVQRRRHHTVLHRQHHLHHARHARSSLRVAEVRLHRPQPQRPVPVDPVRGLECLRLDRVTQRRTGAVRLHRVHVRGRQARVGESRLDDALLRRTVRGRQAVRRTVLVHRRPTDHGQDSPAVALRVGQPLQHQQPDTLGSPEAVGVGGERLAPAVHRQAPLTRELHEHVGRRHHHRATGQREVGFAPAQRLHGQVQGDERRRARGVDRHRRALQAQRIRHPARGDTERGAVAGVGLQVVGNPVQPGHVVLIGHSDEHAGRAARERQRVDARALERLPRRLQQQPLLRIHRQRLTRRDAEERRVEVGGVLQKPSPARVAGAALARVGGDQLVECPATVHREVADRLTPVGEQLPQFLRRADAAREPAAHRHDRDRFVGRGRGRRRADRGLLPQQLATQVSHHRHRRREVEDQCRRQLQSGRRRQAVAQLDRGHRVETEVLEGPAFLHGVRVAVSEDGGGTAAHELQQHPVPLALGQRGEPVRERSVAGTATGRRPTRCPHHTAQQPRQRVGLRAQRRAIEQHG